MALTIFPNLHQDIAKNFCNQFITASPEKRYVFGINNYGERIADKLDIAAYVDDFTPEKEHLGKPIIKTSDVPHDGLVISTLLGKPLTAKRVLSDASVNFLDFFSFYSYSDINLGNVRFWSDFNKEFNANRKHYEEIYDRLVDEESRDVFTRIINFRLTADLSYMEGFSDREKFQYFEPFLALKKENEVFIDVGGFDGYTSLEFIKNCPDYKAIYFFEPEEKNMLIARNNLAGHPNVHFIQKGLSDNKATVGFSAGGSISAITEEGDYEIEVDLLDQMVSEKVSFIKMDVEGAESLAIEGAKETIRRDQPTMALCVYHYPDDLWKIASQVFSIRDDYDLYLRHYTEGVAETVMFFIPRKSS